MNQSPHLPTPDEQTDEESTAGQRLQWVDATRRPGGGWVGPSLAFVVTIVAALAAAVPVIYMAGSDPFTAYGALFQGSLGSQRGLAETLVSTSPLLLAGLAVAVAFQAGLFNIGAEGQLLMGGLVAGAIGAELNLPLGLHLLAAIVGGILAGGLWGLVPGLLKAYKGVHEVVTTIMLNFVAFSVSRYLVSPGGLLVSSGQPSATEKVLPTATLTRIWAPTRLHTGILVAMLTAGFMWYFLYRTPAGYRFRFVGANPAAARFTGISPRAVTVQSMIMSGGLAGLAGAVEVLGLHGRYFDAFSPGYGFDAIAVALLGLLNPLGVVAAALVFGMLRAGSSLLQASAGISRDMITVISGLVVAFVAGRVAVQTLIARHRKKQVEAATAAEPRITASGYGGGVP